MYNDENIPESSMSGRNGMPDRPEVRLHSVPVPPGTGALPASLVRVIWRNRWIITVSIIVSLALAFVYITNATPIYRSISRIYVEQNGPKIINETVEGVMTQSQNYLFNQVALLTSTPILASALETPGLREMRTFARVDNPVAYLNKTLDVGVGRKDDIISVAFDSPYPAEAALIVNTIVESYISYYSSQKRSTSSDVLKILQTEKDKRSKELEEKLNAMMEFRKKNEALAFESSQGNIVMERLQKLSEALTQAQMETIESKYAYDTMEEIVNDSVKLQEFVASQEASGAFISTGNIKNELKSRLEELKFRLSDRLRNGLTTSHPSVSALQNDIQNIQKQLDDIDTLFAKSRLSVAQRQYMASKEKEEQISKHYEQQRQEALALNEQLAQYTILQSEWEQTKKYCDIIDDQIRALNVTEDVGPLNIIIVEVARAADKPSKPQKSRTMAFALIIGGILGSGLSIGRDMMDQKLHTAEEVSGMLGVPLLGVVPSMSRKEKASERGQKVYLDSRSFWAEAYRTIRTAIFFSAPKEKAKTILVTSPTPSDGKTTLASNLAIAMAQAGQKTLVLDADFRKPMQHNIFGIAHNDTGIINVLTGACALSKVIKPSGIKGLALLSRGPDVPNPSEVLNSAAFAKLIEYLSTKFDRIIIDSPPVSPVTDAQILAAICDMTILVLRAEKSTLKVSRHVRDVLFSVGARVLGVVVNDVPRKNNGYYIGYEHYYGRDDSGKAKISQKSFKKAVAL